jgi:hypothetical protein
MSASLFLMVLLGENPYFFFSKAGIKIQEV